jgi:hypothetical protein
VALAVFAVLIAGDMVAGNIRKEAGGPRFTGRALDRTGPGRGRSSVPGGVSLHRTAFSYNDPTTG